MPGLKVLGNWTEHSSPDHLVTVLLWAKSPIPSPDLGVPGPHLFREPPKSRQAMAFFMSVPPKMEGAMLLEMTS